MAQTPDNPFGPFDPPDPEPDWDLILREHARYRETLEGIANADWRKWDSGMNSPEDFVAWAQSRARNSINP